MASSCRLRSAGEPFAVGKRNCRYGLVDRVSDRETRPLPFLNCENKSFPRYSSTPLGLQTSVSSENIFMPPAVFFLRSCHPPILSVPVNTSRPGLQLTTSGWVSSHAQPGSVVTTHKKIPEFHIPLKRSPLPMIGERRLGPAVRCTLSQRVPGRVSSKGYSA